MSIQPGDMRFRCEVSINEGNITQQDIPTLRAGDNRILNGFDTLVIATGFYTEQLASGQQSATGDISTFALNGLHHLTQWNAKLCQPGRLYIHPHQLVREAAHRYLF